MGMKFSFTLTKYQPRFLAFPFFLPKICKGCMHLVSMFHFIFVPFSISGLSSNNFSTKESLYARGNYLIRVFNTCLVSLAIIYITSYLLNKIIVRRRRMHSASYIKTFSAVAYLNISIADSIKLLIFY